MQEFTVYGDTLPEAYHKALMRLQKHGEITDCADWNTRQKEVSMTMIVGDPLKEPRISKCFIGSPRELEQYRMEMLDGILDFEVEKGKWEYTYHQRYADQIDAVINELKRNPSSRRAVMVIRRPEDIDSADPACLQIVQYFIRRNALDCVVLFRSNDACKATFMNAFALIELQKRIAERLGVKVGTYTHRANSFHAYEKDWSMLDGYVRRIRDDMYHLSDAGITYDYNGDWQELMEDEREDILKQVEVLKER